MSLLSRLPRVRPCLYNPFDGGALVGTAHVLFPTEVIHLAWAFGLGLIVRRPL